MIRFAILAGVSSDRQAHEHKDSIPDQIKFCRGKIKALGGLETVEPFIMDGYSRTDYDSLPAAMADIPPLAQCIEAATKDEYDVLMLDNFDRLGDLGLMVGARFRKLRKQLYSARQSGVLADPRTYDPHDNEAADIDMYVEGLINRYRINKMRRGWKVGVPKRIDLGLPPFRVAYGYDRTGKDTPPVQN